MEVGENRVRMFYKVWWRLCRPLEAPRLISSPANPELPFLAAPILPDVYGSDILLEFKFIRSSLGQLLVI